MGERRWKEMRQSKEENYVLIGGVVKSFVKGACGCRLRRRGCRRRGGGCGR